MKSSLISTSVAVLLASNSIVTFASSLTIPNTFTAGTKAVAADVNANFDAVVTSVDDNDSRITTNTGAISTNATGISNNAAGISTNAGNINGNTNAINTNTTNIGNNTTAIGTNTTNIGNNTTAIGTNTTNIGANTTAISALQGAVNCPSDMVSAGSLCVDKYEASVWDAPTGGTQYGVSSDDYLCNNDGSDCGVGAPAANPIYARSVAGVAPSTNITLYQAAQACANVGKRLPTTGEWQMAASGTPSGTGDGTTGCNSNAGNSQGVTGNAPTCVSSAGAFDMVGNVWEWVSDLDIDQTTVPLPSLITTTDTQTARALGQDFADSGATTPNTASLLILDNSGTFGFAAGPLSSANGILGFRCVR